MFAEDAERPSVAIESEQGAVSVPLAPEALVTSKGIATHSRTLSARPELYGRDTGAHRVCVKRKSDHIKAAVDGGPRCFKTNHLALSERARSAKDEGDI